MLEVEVHLPVSPAWVLWGDRHRIKMIQVGEKRKRKKKKKINKMIQTII